MANSSESRTSQKRNAQVKKPVRINSKKRRRRRIIKRIVIAIIVVFATCFISLTYLLNWIRYALIAVGIVTVIIKRNNIISAVRMKR